MLKKKIYKNLQHLNSHFFPKTKKNKKKYYTCIFDIQPILFDSTVAYQNKKQWQAADQFFYGQQTKLSDTMKRLIN